MFVAGVIIILLFVLSHSSNSQYVWQRSPLNPVVKATGEFLLALDPSVLYDSAHGRYDMWFMGKNPTYTSSFAIYHARSTDRATWLIDPTGPVLYPDSLGSYDSDVRGPCVIRDKAGYKMYFLAQGVGGYTFGVATSADGVMWTKYPGNPILSKGPSGSWESQAVGFPNVIFHGSTYYLWYGGSDGNTGSIGLATSMDGLTWTKYANNPVLEASAEGWDALGVGQPAVALANGKFYMLYDASSTSYCCASRIGAATSTDGIQWIKYLNNPVFVQGPPGAWDDEAVASAALVFLQDTFHLWYSALSSSTGRWQTGYASSALGASPPPPSPVDSLLVLQRSPQNPVLSTTGGFSYALDPSVLYDSAHGRYDMWFAGKNPTYTSTLAIYHARSVDKVTWTIDPGGPALYPDSLGSYDDAVRGPSVIRDGSGYKMYFHAQGISGYSFGVATSPDGLTWTKYPGNPIIMKGASGTWESDVIAFPNVYFDGSTYYLWYGGSDGNTGSIGLATSADGFTWTKYVNNPVLKASADGWDALGVGQPSVTLANGKLYMFYCASLTSFCCATRIGAATSADGIHWAKYANNPVFVPGSAGSWDDEAVATGSLVFRESSFQFWYSALSSSTGRWQTGYATSSLASVPPPSQDTVVALWHFDEGSGNILHDASPYHNDGQIHNCQWVPGRFGSALHFDGLTSYVVLPNSPSLKPVNEFTLEAWISPDTLQFGSSPYGTAGAIVSNLGPYPDGGGYETALINPGVFRFDDRSPNSVGNFSGTTPIPQTHKFYHVALVYKQVASGDNGSAIVKTYLNGLLTDSSVIPAPIQYDNTPNFYIGTNMDGRAVGNIGVREFLGILDEIRISKVALNPSQFDVPHGESMMALHVRDAGGGYGELQFGTMPGATDGLDTAFGEQELPPKPPKGSFDARWLIPGTQGSLVDVEDTLGGTGPQQDTLGGPRPQNEYAGTAQPGPGGFPITLQWDPNSLPSGSFELVDQVSYGNGYRVNMRVQNSFVLSDTSPQPFIIVYNNTPSFVGSVFPAWNMISLPLTVPDRSVKTLFPMSSSKAFGYHGGYVPVDSLAYGLGYWIKFDTAQSIGVSGSLITTDTVSVAMGWNMIGTVSAPMPVEEIVQIPASNVVSRYFNYQGGYHYAASLLPMRAYWVKVNSDGKLVLNKSASNAALRLAALRQDDAGLSRLDIADAKGNAATLYVASRLEVGDRFDASQYVAPPAPPVGAFDARFSADQLAVLYEVGRTGPQQYEIDIQAAAYPVKISWNFVHAGSAVFALIDAARGKEIAPNIGGTGSVLVTNKAVNKLYFVVNTGEKADVPGQFALEQNYPNPFNPTTMVQYALPKDAFVTLKVYSLVGQEVATLVQGRQSAGYHTAVWDASNAPSGVYFCHMAAGTYTAVRKMVLIK